MTLRAFNTLLLAGWLLVLIGGMVINVGAGIAFAGALMIALTIFCARIGGLHAPKDEGAD